MNCVGHGCATSLFIRLHSHDVGADERGLQDIAIPFRRAAGFPDRKEASSTAAGGDGGLEFVAMKLRGGCGNADGVLRQRVIEDTLDWRCVVIIEREVEVDGAIVGFEGWFQLKAKAAWLYSACKFMSMLD